MEKWKSIEGSKYYISNKGNIINKDTKRILKQSILDKKGLKTKRIRIPINGERKNCIVHRLIAEAFIPNPHNKPEVDHINRDSLDNRISNLRWATRQENIDNRGFISIESIKEIIQLNKEGRTENEIYEIFKK